MPTTSTKKEQIDERILRILGLNPEEVEMDYTTYHNALREAMETGSKSGLPQEELALLVNERRRIRGNREGRFQVKTEKVKLNSNNLKSPIKEKETPRKTLKNKLGKDVVSKLSDDQIKKLSEYYNSLPPKERKKVDSEIANKRGEFFDIARGMAGIKFVELNENEKQKFTPDAVGVEQGPILPPKEEGGDVYSERKVKLNSNPNCVNRC